jgi:hypothetical protein
VARQKLDIFSSNPDLVIRWSSDRLPRLISGRLTVYASPADRALLASAILFRSRKRVGRFSPADIPQSVQDYFGKWGNIDLIVYQGKSTDRFGHSYFSTNPDVSADLIQLVRFDRAPGEPGRPLIRKGPAAWTFPDRKLKAAGQSTFGLSVER